MGVIELRERMAGLLGELAPLSEAESRSAEQDARIDQILAEVSDLGPRIEREQKIAAAAARSSDFSEPVRRVAATAPAAEERPQADRRSVGRRFVESGEYRMVQQTGRANPAKFSLGGSAFPQYLRAEDGLQTRDLHYTGQLPEGLTQPQVLPGVYRGIEAPLVMRQVLQAIRTTSDAITVILESTFNNGAAEVSEAEGTSGTAVDDGYKPGTLIELDQETYPIQYIAHTVDITRQMLADHAFVESYVNGRLLDGLARREDDEFLNGDGTAPNIRGLLNTSGIQDLDDSYFGSYPVVGAGTDNENYNRVLRAKMKIQVTGGARATFAVVNPTDMEIFLTLSDENRGYMLGGGPGAGGNIPTMWGLPLVLSENITAGTVLVGDGTMAAVADREDATIYTTDSHADYFKRNIISILAEERVGLVVYRPSAFAKVELAAA